MPGVSILWSKFFFSIIFQKENGNTFTVFIIFVVKSLQKEQIAQIYYYDPQSAGMNLQSPQSDSTPWTLTLSLSLNYTMFCNKVCWNDTRRNDSHCIAQRKSLVICSYIYMLNLWLKLGWMWGKRMRKSDVLWLNRTYKIWI